jgi:hypothetical protein
MSAAYAVPRISAIRASTVTRVQLYRDDDALVETSGLDDVVTSNQPLDLSADRWNARAIGAFELDRTSLESARLIVTPNHVQAAGPSLTSLSREADGWWATFTCRLQVEKGMLGTFELEAPAAWSGPIEIKSNAPATLETEPLGESQTTLKVRFANPLEAGHDLNLELRGRLAAESAALIVVPEIVPKVSLIGPRYVCVPTWLDSQPMAWSETGVRPAQLPADLSPHKDGKVKWTAYEVVTNPIHVALIPALVQPIGASVRLVDTIVGLEPAGHQLIFTRMVVVPQNLAECTLAIPSDQELLHVAADGRPAAIRPLGPHRWRLTLGPSQLPQYIEIVSRTQAGNHKSASHVELRRPQLLIQDDAMPVEMSLWSFNHSSRPGDVIVSGADRVTRAQQSASRLDRLVSISEASTPAAVEASFPDGYNWYHPWAARLIELRRETLQAVAEPESGSATSKVVSPKEEQIAQASERLDAWLEQCDAILSWTELDPSPPAPNVKTLVTTPPIDLAGHSWSHLIAEGGNAVLSVELRSVSAARRSRLAGLAVIAAATAATISLLRRPVAWDIVCRWPHAAVFLLGVVYWAFLRPSWLGILIALASMVLALRSGWPGQSLRSEGSTVLRLPPR